MRLAAYIARRSRGNGEDPRYAAVLTRFGDDQGSRGKAGHGARIARRPGELPRVTGGFEVADVELVDRPVS